MMPVDVLSCGEWADVAEVSGEPSWITRLAELGLRVGSRIRVLQQGTPCILQVGDARLSLRGDAVLQVLVQPIHAAL